MLHFENGVMSCLACRAYPQMGLQKVWLDGTPHVRKHAVVAHGNSGVHAVAMALWERFSPCATLIGGLPLPVRWAIFGLFHMVSRLVKRYGCFTQLAADAETATLVGGHLAPAYRSRAAAREIAMFRYAAHAPRPVRGASCVPVGMTAMPLCWVRSRILCSTCLCRPERSTPEDWYRMALAHCMG